jgi:hypothetical protein
MDAAYMREWRRRNPEKLAAYKRRYMATAKGREKARQDSHRHNVKTGRAKLRRQCDALTVDYVRTLLSVGTSIPKSAWPQWLVDLKRLNIRLKRKYGIHQNHRGRIKQAD